MTRSFSSFSLASALIALSLGLSVPSASLAADVKKDVQVTGPMVTLGDLFTDVGMAAETPIAPAPLPSQSRIFDAHSLMEIARQNGISWPAAKGQTGATYSTVTRTSKTLPASDIEQLLPALLQSTDNRTKVRLDNRNTVVVIPAETEAVPALSNVNLDTSTQRFSATLVYQEGNTIVAEAPVSGRLVRVDSIPVLARAVRAGEVISAADITWQDMDSTPSTAAYIADAEKMIGKTPRQALQAGQPVKPFQLLAPAVITKGSLVTMIYHQGGLQITAQGRALSDAAQGETLRVANLASSRTVEAQAEGAGLVRVGGSAPIVMSRN